MDELENVSITVCGDGGTGKSSISLRLVRSKWTHEYDPTVQDSYSVTRIIDGRTYHLNLTDTAGQEEYRGLWAAQNLEADAYLLVYDITSAESLAALDYFDDLIEMGTDERMSKEGAIPHVKIVAGNKCDLANSRQVTSAQGLAWAREHNCGFMETSARNVVNIEETFALLVRRVVAAREEVRNGGLIAHHQQQQADADAIERQNEKTEVSKMDDYDEPGSKRSRWCCTIM
ncbi:P-loop containing nucleoside triphosphate hydrolase protein [Geopyxis carbonaria]|nr:P-loop containing nucleoside triphosphate hydrolase protein [Geopyxis carbonaria]